MSSILEALRRLEKEEPPPVNHTRKTSWLHPPHFRQGPVQRAAGFFLAGGRDLWLVVSAVLVIGAVAAVLVVFGPSERSGSGGSAGLQSPNAGAVSEKDPSAPATPASIAENQGGIAPVRNPQSSAGKGAGRIAENRVSDPQRAEYAPPAPRSGRQLDNPPAKTGQVLAGEGQKGGATGQGTPPPSTDVRPSGKTSASAASSEASGATQRQIPASQAADAGDMASRSAASTDSGEDSAVSDAQRLPEESGLSLQAISWAEGPGNRIAVINGRIMKEGEQIEGYILWRIQKDDVFFSYSGQIWKLGFRRR